MKKKLLSLALALCMVFGSAASLPQGAFTETAGITASAAAPTINTKSVTLYALDDWAKEYISIPSTLNTEYQLKVSNAKNVSYYVSEGDSVNVSDSGVVTPSTTTWYWYGGFGTSWPQEGQEPTRISVDVNYGKSTITVNADGTTFKVSADVRDYSDTYADKVMDDYIKKNITSSMTGKQKLTEIAKFVASYDYSASCSSCTSMIVCKGGDCWASTDTIVKMCKKLGIEAWERNGNRDAGAGSGHKNAMAYVDGKYYEVEAGYSGKAPRPYDITERDSLFSFSYDYTYDGYEVYQYDGPKNPETLNIPKQYNGKPVVSVGEKFVQSEKGIKKIVLPSTIKSIGRSAFNSCEDLETLNLPASVVEIDQLAFTNLTKLKEITGSNKTFKWANGGLIKNGTTLLAVPNAKSYKIPDTVTEIADYAFYYNNNIKTLTIPSSVKTIGEGAIGDCDSLETLYIQGNNLKNLGNFAFANDDKLGAVYIPDSVTNIGENFKYYLGSKFKILCHEGSKIAEYAEKEKIPFELIDKSLEHLYETTVTKAATCTQDGVKTKRCQMCGKTITESIPKIGHKYTTKEIKPTCTQDGVKTKRCQMCGKTITESIPKLGHKYTTKEIKVTCTTDGCTLKTCSRCGHQVKTNIVKTTGHKWSVWRNEKDPTCIEDGSKTRTCSVCKKTETQKIAKLGHTWKEPVWTWSGTSEATAMFVCSKCKTEMRVHANITSVQNTAKCGTTGGTVYTASATLGGKTYTDKKTVGTGTIPHKWGAVTYTWSKDNHTCTATRVCLNDKSHKQTETVKTTYKVVKTNCTADGTGRYTAVFTNSAFGTRTKDITLKSNGGHTFSDWTTTKKATCTTDGSKTRTCSVCKKTETATIAKLGHDYKTTVVKPTCTAKGYTLHKCSRCGDSYKDTYKDATGHSWSKWTTTKKATCTADGEQTRTCSVCKKTETAAIAKLGHDYKATVVKPTCTAKGYTLHKCSRCGDSYKDTYKDATGHKWSKWTTTKKATCTADGTQTRKCSVCGKTETKTIKATGHKLTATPAKAATCTTNGNKAYWYCSTCKKYFSDKNGKTAITKASTVVKATGHKFTAWKTTSFNVDKGTSTQKRTCSVCKKTETRPVKNAVVRYAGANRYDTAAMLSKASHKTTSDTVIIADAMTFQDALIAVPLAKAYNAPLLLANPNIVTKQTEAELARLKAKKVIIVNTSNALKKGTLDDLKKKYTTQIIRGNNCFETSKRVAEELQKKTKKAPTDVFFTTNKAFADALSISPVAALKGAPILYVDPTKKTLDSNILAYLNKVKGSIKNVYIVGGKVAVPTAIENSIKKALPKKNVKRFDGAQRYETCVMINNYFAKGLLKQNSMHRKGT